MNLTRFLSDFFAWTSIADSRPKSLTAALWIAVFFLSVFLTWPGCPQNGAPGVDPIADQTATVGEELVVLVQGRDPEGDALTFTLQAPSIKDMDQRPHPPRFETFGPQAAYLHWTPMAMDVGIHELTVVVSDGKNKVDVSFTVTVQAGDAVPVFRKPLGDGTTLDLATQQCLDVDVVVEDLDSSEVDIYLEDPIETGYEFTQDDPLAGTFSWCPEPKQVEASDLYVLNLAANDRDGHITKKKYTIVIRRDLQSNCPGQPPAITHQSQGQVETFDDISLQAQVTDDQGLATPPVLYYSTTAPSDPANPDFSKFEQMTMTRQSGDKQNGFYLATVPNPVLSEAAGTTKTLYYFIEATDDDDSSGDCDHRTRLPAADVFRLDVTKPSGAGSFESCAACRDDIQCGDQGLCVTLGGSESYCLARCGQGQQCPADTSCTASTLTSVTGQSDNVCAPVSGSCGQACREDGLENNDSFDDAVVITPGTFPNLTLCDDADGTIDDDYYLFEVPQLDNVTVSIAFSTAQGDLDLDLLDEHGNLITSSFSLTDDESITKCLEPGLYEARVFTFDPSIATDYSLALEFSGQGCCIQDNNEPDDDPAHATNVQAGDNFDDMWLCSGNEDWYAIVLDAGQTVVVDLLFDQNDTDQDLDLHFYDADGWTDLTPCPPCDIDNGQSGTSDEHMEYTVNAHHTYFVVVKGYESSQNSYMIGFDVRNP